MISAVRRKNRSLISTAVESRGIAASRLRMRTSNMGKSAAWLRVNPGRKSAHACCQRAPSERELPPLRGGPEAILRLAPALQSEKSVASMAFRFSGSMVLIEEPSSRVFDAKVLPSSANCSRILSR